MSKTHKNTKVLTEEEMNWLEEKLRPRGMKTLLAKHLGLSAQHLSPLINKGIMNSSIWDKIKVYFEPVEESLTAEES